jgi:parallel beta-helix repeat protein
MKRILTILIFISLQASATNYYFSINGNDANNNTGNTPWQSATKFAVLLRTADAGDSILFKRGEVFSGFIVTHCNSGISFGAYGTGAAPIISGFTALTSWKETSSSPHSNIWIASCNSGTNLDLVTVNGIIIPAGRTPNAGLYFNIDSFTKLSGGTGTVTSRDIPSTRQNWKGAEAVMALNAFNRDRNKVVAHDNSTITYTSPDNPKSISDAGNKFFLQKHPATLDQQNEWYYSPDGTLRMYSHVNPATLNVMAATQDYFFKVDFRNNISFTNLKFQGLDSFGISGRFPVRYKIIGNTFEDIGTDAIILDTDSSARIWNNIIKRCGNSGIVALAAAHTWVDNNTIDSCGVFIGMGLGNNQQGDGIKVECYPGDLRTPGDSIIITNNRVTNSGFCGIMFTGINVQVYNNFVNHSGLIKSDAGGIYTNGLHNLSHQRIIRDNVIINGYGNNDMMHNPAPGGFPGIYLDDATGNVDVIRNSIDSATRYGIFLHNCHEINILDNTILNTAGEAAIGSEHDALEPSEKTRNIVIKRNIIHNPTGIKAINIFIYDADDIAKIGTIDSNFYSGTSSANLVKYQAGSTIKNYTLATWSASNGYDRSSKMQVVSPGSVKFVYNASSIAKTISLTSTHTDLKGKTYTGTIKVPAWKSVILIEKSMKKKH